MTDAGGDAPGALRRIASATPPRALGSDPRDMPVPGVVVRCPLRLLCLCVLLSGLLAGCAAAPASTGQAAGPSTPSPAPTEAPTPPLSITPEPSEAPAEAPTEAPTASPRPPTATPEPSEAPAEAPTASPQPPTVTPEPPVATASPQPPTVTPELPVATATPTSTPAPAPTGAAEPAAPVYTFPVRAADPATVSYGEFHYDYPAADIFCPTGSEFVAPTSGIIDFVSPTDLWSPATDNPADRGGLSVALVGDDGWRYYGSHLSQVADGIAPGVRVEAGQLLGLTGQSGNAASTPPHLHFGISRPTTPDDWQARRGQIPPYASLRAWQRGENATPAP